ncbi:MAG: MFS transporter [Lachnospiraceae bacterium]|nr:MFS transporter [Lachnospiraceae bacterium]
MKQKLTKKFWVALVIFSLMGQVAWVVENMYFNVFIYKIFHADAAHISLMVGASAVMATITTLIMGALSDKVGKRKVFISGGYILWGLSILSFSLLRMDVLTGITQDAVAAASLGINLTILMDCVMTFFGSTANDACFNAWLVESGDDSNRGTIEGINAMMPLVSILVVFGGFMAFDLNKESSWTWIFLIIGFAVIAIGILGFFLIHETTVKAQDNKSFWNNLLYSFRPSVMKSNLLLYVVVGAFSIFNISISTFMPYLIIYYEQSLQMANYVLIMAPAIILAAIVTVVFGKLYDQLGFRRCAYITLGILMAGYVMLFFFTGTALVFVGSLLMMSGYLAGMAVFGAKIKGLTPEEKAGLFQGLRIFGQVFIPGIVGPAIGAFVLRDAQVIVNGDGTTSFLPNRNIFAAAFVVAVLLFVALKFIFRMVRNGHRDLPTDLGDGSEKELPFAEYPRPQLKRDSYMNLNGKWEEGIMVPFPPQSSLSGLDKKQAKKLGKTHAIYTRKFVLPKDFVTSEDLTSEKKRLLLHFGAVDQIAKVYLNEQLVGENEGGYLPFTLDITDAYKEGENLLKVEVTDKLDKVYPYGKQCKARGEMWYTPISGIWQSVWMESVPETYVQGLKITPDLTGIDLEVKVRGSAETCQVVIYCGDSEICKKVTLMADGTGAVGKCRIDLKEEGVEPILWSPENPHLYDLKVTVGEDVIESYFGLRQITIGKAGANNRILLNGKPIFLHAVLDQGYYSDGIYLPASEKGYEFDIKAMQELGFNTLRKHIKIEPECFYYLCDKMGMLVMQDLVNSGRYSFTRDTAMPTVGAPNTVTNLRIISKKHKEVFLAQMEGTIDHLYNHPCIVYYTIFNEGWGQFEADEMYDRFVALDHTRIVDATSGWFRGQKSDVESSHVYFRNEVFDTSERPHVLSEFGGHSLVMEEHCFSLYNQHGYSFAKDIEEVTDRLVDSYEQMVIPSIKGSLCGSVYTQLSDVEDEVNGLYTYDRKVCKINKQRVQELSKKIFETYANETN